MNPGSNVFVSTRLNPILLTLGAFDLVGEGGSWLCEALADGTDLAGNPVPVEVAIQTLIQDGSVSYTEKYDNSTITIKVCISGPDAEAIDDGAAALFAELGKPNTLTYGGPQASGLVAWDVVNSRLERNSDDLAEVRNERYYTITLSCLPFRRATTETITPALPTSGSTTVTVDNANQTTGWTGIPGTVAVESSAVKVTWAPASGVPTPVNLIMEMTRSGLLLDMTSTPYLVVDWKNIPDGSPTQLYVNPTTIINGILFPAYPKVFEGVSPVAGYTRTYFDMSNSGADGTTAFPLRFVSQTTLPSGGKDPATIPPRTFSIANVSRTNEQPGSGKQRIRSIEIEGSAPTPGAIAIEHETAALGDVITYFWPDDASGYQPNLRQFKTSGTDNSVASAISGVRTVTPFVAEIPTRRLISGGHLLVARVSNSSTATVTFTWSATTVINGVDIGPTVTGSRAIPLVAVSGTGVFSIAALGRVILPTLAVDPAGAGAVVRITITPSGLGGVDEAWLFNREVGQLSVIPVGSGTPSAGGPSNRIWMEPATAQNPKPTLWRGFAADRSDAFHPLGAESWEFPEFRPRRVNALLVTTEATDAAISFRHFERKAG